ncbi:heavy metal-responsive transcriptional regulator [Leucobacter coleopterorum]|uniref:Heavy metal-responsive transcriptional regulator n=1 Tax=Leucobacter coleopterorum TaxID=2714933 RepID=A0ABX6JVP6_9MICO|nr:heavy metal-responsive transcriptional regulator [Leucobacter coleopterorum]QIM18386.1 heavy metal-responsive transcriptional regulator [Leucobacter coleopterorum]
MRIAEIARKAGVKVSTVRYHERHGVLPEPDRTQAGYRDYDNDALQYVRFLRRGQALGFTLSELKELAAYPTGVRHGHVRRDEVVEVASAKLDEIDERIADLKRTRAAIETLLNAECIDPLSPCPIVTALAESSSHATA